MFTKSHSDKSFRWSFGASGSTIASTSTASGDSTWSEYKGKLQALPWREMVCD